MLFSSSGRTKAAYEETRARSSSGSEARKVANAAQPSADRAVFASGALCESRSTVRNFSDKSGASSELLSGEAAALPLDCAGL